jgi:peroxiredoxin
LAEPEPERSGNRAGWIVGGLALAVAALLIQFGKPVPPPLARGVSAPGFELPALDTGEPVTLAGLRGQVVLVNFWATWCKPCEDEMPAMERLYRRLAPQGFELLAVSVDEDPAVVAQFRDRLGISFPIAMDSSQEVSRLYQTTGYPESILIDRDGKVVERYIGPKDWDYAIYVERIQKLLEPGA